MKIIIIGLGNFGSSLAAKLTEQGNEVIGIDSDMKKVTTLKDKISHTICMDATDKNTVTDLPLNNTDIVIVCIGQNEGINVLVTALFKNLGVKRLISRSADSLHEDILRAIGVDEILNPEEETAERWAKKLCFSDINDSFELNKEYSIVEVKTPKSFIGKTMEEIDCRANYDISIITIIKPFVKGSFFGKNKTNVINGFPEPTTLIEKDDVLVIFGKKENLTKLLKLNVV
ncbi:MAG: TrkA family potassium uptake protein [Chitinophagaceae bacterium]|nr:TrkA family potassium uptake protein [Chitinophagaceae bacterium]MCW5904610.1 TrkA family potassium uptake protein [Chitinophagaceae bacterium]